jgi:hypothetical protein
MVSCNIYSFSGRLSLRTLVYDVHESIAPQNAQNSKAPTASALLLYYRSNLFVIYLSRYPITGFNHLYQKYSPIKYGSFGYIAYCRDLQAFNYGFNYG